MNHSSSSSSTGDGSIAEGADALSAMRETAIDNGNSLCGPLTGTLCHSTSHDMPIADWLVPHRVFPVQIRLVE